MWIKRDIEAHIQSLADKRACLVLTGARQTGKTSLLTHLFPDIPTTSLDLPRIAEEADTSGETFLQRIGSPAIIDEVQYAPGLFRYLKHAIDASKKAPGQYFLTGSQKFHLMESVSESLSGRASILEIHTLSVAELERWAGVAANGDQLWRWIFLGGYPEIYERNFSPSQFFSDYLATYIERDVRKVINIKNVRQFDQFMRLISTRIGQLLSVSSISNDLGISATTARQWLNVLIVTNVVELVEPWFANARKRIVKTPKLYFLDTGLACYLAGLDSHTSINQSPLKGALFENHVFSELTKAAWNRGERPKLYFFRDHVGNEIDFVRHKGGNFDLLECKTAESPKIVLKPFEAFQACFPQSRNQYYYVVPARGGPRKSQVGEVVITDALSVPP